MLWKEANPIYNPSDPEKDKREIGRQVTRDGTEEQDKSWCLRAHGLLHADGTETTKRLPGPL